MEITSFVEALRRDLGHAAEAGDEDVRAAADRLALALDPAVRLMLMDALSQAASEITNELDDTVVEVRLKGREPAFVVSRVPGPQVPPTTPPGAPGPPPPPGADEGLDDGDDAVARITLRLPESLKVRAEELAAGRGQSLNTWLVNAARVATTSDFSLDVSSTGISMAMGPGAPGRNRSSNKRIQGWVR
ncbi:MAG: hypothetical protein AVDCRST_MAG21-1655 [uncultured Nocardioidaceae bacterium]|uniref:Toxin-antitoxin system HicB family antitoxin n=1 Tax=uncultured Nocardioidaceae bacterium TaxID=253824 RepID=A0A6J4N8C3_9ACTN|nr:MAG: hypothetical protein AVDCRST_MAG21-1655 [uncultured Nocardioidaceae bacterium]